MLLTSRHRGIPCKLKFQIRLLLTAFLAVTTGSALAQTAISIDPPPAGPLSFGNLAGHDTALQNNTTVHTLSVNAGSTWSGTDFYGLFNSAGKTIDTGGFTVNAGATVYGGTAGIYNAAGSTISSSTANAIGNSGTIGKLGVSLSTNGIANDGTISTSTANPVISNSGTITGSNSGILNSATGTISNSSSGTLISNLVGGTIGGSSSTYGILNRGTMRGTTGAVLVNNGTLTGTTAGFYNDTSATVTTRNLNYTIKNAGTLGGASSQIRYL